MNFDNSHDARIKLLEQARVGDPATLQNGWKGYVHTIEGAYVRVRVPGRKTLYQCSPLAVDSIRKLCGIMDR